MDSHATYYYTHAQEEHQYHQHQHQPQIWEPNHYDAQALDAPVFSHPFDPKHVPLPVQVPHSAEPLDEALFTSYSYQPQQPQPYYNHQQAHPQSYGPFVDTSAYSHATHQAQFQYYAPSPTLSDLSSLSALTNSPLSPPHALTPLSPHHQTSALGLGFVAEPVASTSATMLPPMPLDAHLDAHMPLGVATSNLSPPTSTQYSASMTPPALPSPTSATAPSTASTGPAPGEYAVLTLTGHTIAASSSYRNVLTAARSVRKAQESGLGDDSRTCHFCGKVCDRPSTLKTHLNSHTGARPHTCSVPGCDRQFTVLSNMYRHSKVCAAQRAREVRKAAQAARRA